MAIWRANKTKLWKSETSWNMVAISSVYLLSVLARKHLHYKQQLLRYEPKNSN